MAFLSRLNQSQNFNQKTKTQSEEVGYQRICQPYQKRNASFPNDVELETEQKIEQILGKARSTIVVDMINKADELTTQDLEIIAEVQQHIEEEQKQVVEEEQVDAFLCSISKCYLPECKVHTVLPKCIHYGSMKGDGYGKLNEMSPRMKKGYDYYCKNPGCSHVEVYERHICVVAYNGVTQVFDE